jgi:nucleoside-diphosphate-sugar epimerase
MKWLVTGSRGFLGRNVVEHLRVQGHEVYDTDNIDLTDPDQVNTLPDVDIVLHFAAVNKPLMFATRPFDVLGINILATHNLISHYQGRIQRFVLASTSEVYAGSRDYFDVAMPTPESVPLCVDDASDPRSSYGGSKIANELQVNAMYNQTGTNYSIIRYHNIYGPGQTNQFIPDFVQRVIKTGDCSLTAGDSIRTYLYIDDAVKATVDIALSTACVNQTINIGGNKAYTIRDVANIIIKNLNLDLVIVDRPGGKVRHRQGDIGLAKRLIDFEPTVSLEQGIARVMQKYFDKT